MKKLIIFLVFGLLAFGAMAQRVYQLPANQTYVNSVIATADSIKNTGVKTWYLETARHMPYTYDVRLKIDTVTTPAASSGVSIQLVGKKFVTDDWSNIGSAVVWKSLVTHEVGADTTITWSATTAVRWRYIGLTLTGAGTHAMRPGKLEWKVWEE